MRRGKAVVHDPLYDASRMSELVGETLGMLLESESKDKELDDEAVGDLGGLVDFMSNIA